MEELFDALVPFVAFGMLVFVRVSVMLASLPAPFGNSSPMSVRAALGFLIMLALVSPHWGNVPELSLEPVSLAMAALGELFVGAVIGLTVRVALAAAEVAGNLIGLSMGQGFAATVDPTFGEQMLPSGRFLSGLAVIIFFGLQGHHAALGALAWSLEHAPVGDAFSHAIHEGVLDIGAGLLAQGLRIASPIVGAMFIVQLGMGLVARSAPRVQVFALTFAITSAVGAIVLLASMPSVAAAITEVLSDLPRALRHALI